MAKHTEKAINKTKLRMYKYRELVTAVKNKTPVSQDSWGSGKEQNAHIEVDGICISRVTLPKQHGGTQEIRQGTQESIRKQLLLDRNQFSDFIKCTLSQAGYIGIMREKYLRPQTS
jgi:hypothetical protein